MEVSLHIRAGEEVAQVLSRGRSHGFDLPGRKVRVLDRQDDRLRVRVPGHTEVDGFDRMARGDLRSYVRAASHDLRVLEVHVDRWGGEELICEVQS